jgi:hypothetical protein
MVFLVAGLEQLLRRVDHPRRHVQIGEAIAHRADPRRAVRHHRQRAGVCVRELLVRLHADLALAARQRDQELEERCVEHVGIDRTLQHADHLIERQRVIFVRGRRQRRRLDRHVGAREPRARRGQALLAHDLGDALGARHVLGEAFPVEQL